MNLEVGGQEIFGGALLLDTPVHEDRRGVLIESYRESDFDLAFVQGNISVSRCNVVRGLHYQVTQPQGKLVRTVHGATFNVIVDLREGAPTFGRAFSTIFESPERGLWIPPGFANGFAALADRTMVVYEATDYYCKEGERSLFAFDPELQIPWPRDIVENAILSERDAAAPCLNKAEFVPMSAWA